MHNSIEDNDMFSVSSELLEACEILRRKELGLNHYMSSAEAAKKFYISKMNFMTLL
jgi:hypothetical protein